MAHISYYWKQVEIHPPEADIIADQLGDIATSLELAALELDREKELGGGTWKGKAKNRFYEVQGFNRMPRTLEDSASVVAEHAKAMRHITVTVWVAVEVEVGPRGAE